MGPFECDERRDEGTMEEREIQSNSRKCDFFAFCGQVAFCVGRLFSALLSMDWKSTIGGFQVLAGIWVPRTENGKETVTIICFENATTCSFLC